MSEPRDALLYRGGGAISNATGDVVSVKARRDLAVLGAAHVVTTLAHSVEDEIVEMFFDGGG